MIGLSLILIYTQLHILSVVYHYTLKPSSRKHALCASMYCLQDAASGPCSTTHASRSLRVSGQLQQIFLPDLPSLGAGFTFGVASAA